MESLIERVKKEAGIEVYFPAQGRSDLNDWHNPHNDDSNYVRAVHNLRNPLCNSYPTFGLHSEPKEADSGSDFVSYGALSYKKTIKKEVPCFEKVSQKKPGLLGLLGMIETRTKKIIETVDETVTVNLLVKDYVLSDCSEKAYFVRMTLNAKVEDKFGRVASDYPALTVVGTKNLVDEIVSCLKSNPLNYLSFIRALVPVDKFPNVNNGIFEKAKPGKDIVFISDDKSRTKISL